MSASKFFWKVFWTAVVLGVAAALLQAMIPLGSPQRMQLAVVLTAITVIGVLSLLIAIIAQIWES